jgi:hypothetical protein
MDETNLFTKVKNLNEALTSPETGNIMELHRTTEARKQRALCERAREETVK